jgi:hypothetical protein
MTTLELQRFDREADVPPPVTTSRLSSELGSLSQRLAKAAGVAVGGIVAAGMTVAAAAVAAVPLLDPVLVGVVGPGGQLQEGTMVGFVEVARWDW